MTKLNDVAYRLLGLMACAALASACVGQDDSPPVSGSTGQGTAAGSSDGMQDTATPGDSAGDTAQADTAAASDSGGISDDGSSDAGSETGADGSSGGDGDGDTVVMETTMGTIVIELFPEESPITVANFLAYIDAGFYDGTDGLEATTFHRVVPGFVIQGGGLTADLSSKTTMPAIVNEHANGVENLRGRLSMARTAQPDTATSQFFVNVVDNANLDMPPGYAVFGEVIEGMAVVDAIVAVPTTTQAPFENVPVDPITITAVSVQ